MTDATYVNQKHDAPTKGRQADTIEITDEMLEAGVAALREYSFVEYDIDGALHGAVKSIYEKMTCARMV